MEVYIVNTSDKFSNEELLLCWHLIISWVSKHATHYEIICGKSKNGSSDIINLLSEHATLKEERQKRLKSKMLDMFIKSFFKEMGSPDIFFKGHVDRKLKDILLRGPLPDKSIPIDISPCQQVILYRKEDILFSGYDYGVFQTLYFHDKKDENIFMKMLEKLDIPKNILEKR